MGLYFRNCAELHETVSALFRSSNFAKPSLESLCISTHHWKLCRQRSHVCKNIFCARCGGTIWSWWYDNVPSQIFILTLVDFFIFSLSLLQTDCGKCDFFNQAITKAVSRNKVLFQVVFTANRREKKNRTFRHQFVKGSLQI